MLQLSFALAACAVLPAAARLGPRSPVLRAAPGRAAFVSGGANDPAPALSTDVVAPKLTSAEHSLVLGDKSYYDWNDDVAHDGSDGDDDDYDGDDNCDDDDDDDAIAWRLDGQARILSRPGAGRWRRWRPSSFFSDRSRSQSSSP